MESPTAASEPARANPWLAVLGWGSFALVCALGSVRAFLPGGGNDFSVFYAVWSLVAEGRGIEIYYSTPDRYLYAPGFAWLLSPLGFLPRTLSLALWCAIKIALLAGVVRVMGALLNEGRKTVSAGVLAVATLLVARALLIDFQYGQVNALIVGITVWALSVHLRLLQGRVSPAHAFLAWFALGALGLAKILALAVIAVPWFARTDRRGIWQERAGALCGILLILVLPLATLGFSDALLLMSQWRDALLSRGLPLESHNQSFLALLYHYASGIPTHIVALSRPIQLGWPLLNTNVIHGLGVAWTAVCLLAVLAWMLLPRFRPLRAREQASWIAVLVGLVILPSHLVWKPYFVFGLPLGICAIRLAMESPRRWWVVGLAFFLANLTSFEFVGLMAAARFEAAACMLASHLLLMASVAHWSRGPAPASIQRVSAQ